MNTNHRLGIVSVGFLVHAIIVSIVMARLSSARMIGTTPVAAAAANVPPMANTVPDICGDEQAYAGEFAPFRQPSKTVHDYLAIKTSRQTGLGKYRKAGGVLKLRGENTAGGGFTLAYFYQVWKGYLPISPGRINPTIVGKGLLLAGNSPIVAKPDWLPAHSLPRMVGSR